MDDFRVVVGSSRRIKVDFEAADMFPTSMVPDWKITLEFWPRYITIRKNMVTSDWLDVIGMVAANDLVVVDGEGTDGNDELVAFLNKQGARRPMERPYARPLLRTYRNRNSPFSLETDWTRYCN